MGRLSGKVAVITGGSSGIGRETAILFCKEGAKVVICDVNEKGGRETINMVNEALFGIEEKLKAVDGNVIVYQHADVSKSEDCEKMIQRAEDEFGRLDIVFNNAGIMHPQDDDAVNTEEKIWDLTININLKGVYLGCKYAIPMLRKYGGGSIINTASIVALVGSATPQIAYTASKGGIISMSKELAIVHAKENIRVNALCPGPLKTELLMKFLDTKEKLNRRLVHLPMGRFGEAKEMAKGALYLASDDSEYYTGQEHIIDGGLTSAYVTPE